MNMDAEHSNNGRNSAETATTETSQNANGSKTRATKIKNGKVSRSSRAGLEFPVGRIQRLLKKGRYADRIGNSAAIYLAGVLEYLTGELVDLAGETCKDYKMKRILPRHILTTIKLDEELSTLLKDVTFFHGGFVGSLFLGHLSKATEARMQLSQGVQSTVENEQGHIDEDEHLDGDTEGEEEQNDSDDEEVEMS